MSRRRDLLPMDELHLEPVPATPAQWAAWCWLWDRLLHRHPDHDQACDEAPQAEPAAPDDAP